MGLTKGEYVGWELGGTVEVEGGCLREGGVLDGIGRRAALDFGFQELEGFVGGEELEEVEGGGGEGAGSAGCRNGGVEATFGAGGGH